ncbi:cytosolic phospholipase A2 gamma-like isoform X2 [Phyllobates terribilis]|uniref:cytosolic phospholipase A2 gamma-like isoform X2 n=1 Tax=Phyllobates terribilis TaxID=111132 RepID=UPI003CCA8F98
MDNNEKKTDVVYNECGPSTMTQGPDALTRSKREAASLKSRHKKVWEALRKLNVNVQKNEEPPVIAILGSGGGLRAMVAFLGVLAELAKEDVLDTITYICGTSGSTWCMSSLYNNDQWSSCMEEMERQITHRLLTPLWNEDKAWEKLKLSFSGEIYSLTNFWAYVFVHTVINDINEKTLSNHQTCCESGENPYPVYAAVERDSLNTKNAGTWFEFTPHQVGFPAYKTFVNTELLGSQFRGGNLVKHHPERDLCYLQGLWGSAPGSITIIKNLIKEGLCPSEEWQKLGAFLSSNDLATLTNAEWELLSGDFENIEGLCPCEGCQKMGDFLSSDDLITLTDTELELLSGNFENIGFCEKVILIRKILIALFHWQWGTTNNFLYELSSDIPDDFRNKKFLSLIDAGLEINTAFPLMLPPNRKVDLILSFDFSEGDPFLTLKATEEYCKINGIPFASIDIDDKESEVPSQSCYVFKGDGKETPDVMHFPLFNNQSSEGEVYTLREKYATANICYDESQLQELLKISKLNVELNRDRIVEKFQQLLKCKSSI